MVLALVLGLLGCTTHPPPLPPTAPAAAAGAIAPPSRGLTAEQLKSLETEIGDYRLGPGDIVELYAVDIAELNRKYAVGPDGKITVPGVGVVNLSGLTRGEAATHIEALLKPRYRTPHVDLIVEEYNNNRIFVLGEVRKPGQYNFPGRPLLLSALARAEGLTDKADMRGCTIVRGKGTLLEIDLYDLLRKGDRTLNIPLLPEDAVYVKADEEHTFYVLGEVNHPGVFPRGQDVDVVRAIALAGGQTEDSALKGVRLIHRPAGQPAQIQEINVAAMLAGDTPSNPSIESGDIVYVPRKGAAVFNYYLRQVTPSLNTILLGITAQNLSKQ